MRAMSRAVAQYRASSRLALVV